MCFHKPDSHEAHPVIFADHTAEPTIHIPVKECMSSVLRVNLRS